MRMIAVGGVITLPGKTAGVHDDIAVNRKAGTTRRMLLYQMFRLMTNAAKVSKRKIEAPYPFVSNLQQMG